MSSQEGYLYVALYARGGKPKMPGLEDSYHWAFIIGPKVEKLGSTGKRIHVKEKLSFEGEPAVPQWSWVVEDLEIGMLPTQMLLARMLIAEIEKRDQLEAILRDTPTRSERLGWSCINWVEEALSRIGSVEGLVGRSILDWKAIRDASMQYVTEKKAAHRYDGKVPSDQTMVPTMDLVNHLEVTP